MNTVQLAKIVKIRPIGLDKPARPKMEADSLNQQATFLGSLPFRKGKIPFPNSKLKVAVAAS